MSDQAWSMLAGFVVVVGLRVLDWLLPRGYISRKAKSWSVRNEDEEDQPDHHTWHEPDEDNL